MPKLLFKTDGIVSGEVIFKAGQVYDISDEKGSATRWIKRGAEIVADESINLEVKAEAQVQEQVEVVKKPFKKENKKEIKSSK